MWSLGGRPAGRPAGARAMAVARPTESASITQPHAYVNSIAFSSAAARDYWASLAGATILVVEDAALVGLDVTLALQGLGCTVPGPVSKLSRPLYRRRMLTG